jgi:uncharacterized repeat protein (TIGR03803 family)
MERRILLFLLAIPLMVTGPAYAQSYLSSQTLETLAVFTSFSGHISGKLAEGQDGSFYGVTGSGGTYGQGSVFKVTVQGVLTTMYSFCPKSGCADGSDPNGALIWAKDGNLYGTTFSGGAYGEGTIYRINSAGVETTIYSFCSLANCPDGANPAAGLVEAADGNLYGTTQHGGVDTAAYGFYTDGCGTVYKLTSGGQLSTLYRFCADHSTIDADGRFPYAELVQAADGELYGSTSYGGRNSNSGTIFKISTAGAFQLLHTFCAQFNCADGAEPRSALSQAADGNLYGTTLGSTEDGGNEWGTAFKISTSGSFTTIYSFCQLLACDDGAAPITGLFQAADGNFYGTTIGGGSFGTGTIFRLTPSGALTTLYNFCSVLLASGECYDGNGPQSTLVLSKNGNFYGTTTAEPSSQGTFYSNGTIFSFSVFSGAPALTAATDVLGEGKSEFTVWRPSTGYFFTNDGSGKTAARQWGASTDIPVVGDFDGDGKSDIAVWRPSTGYWYIIQSSDGQVVAKQWGAPTDLPVVGDFDGDGKSDIAVWRPSTGYWYIMQSSDGQVVSKQWGAPADLPVVGDFDGDGKSDIAVWRPSTGYWYIVQSGDGKIVAKQWGESGDVPVPGYYDGPGVTELAVWRPSTGYWYVVQSRTGNVIATQFGQDGDVPVAKDFDGDGKTDIAVWRASDGNWYVINSSTQLHTSYQWGTAGDLPLGTNSAK